MSSIGTPVLSPLNEAKAETILELYRVSGKNSLCYYLFLPKRLTCQTRVMVCIHGISRNAEEQVKTFSQKANQYDYLIIAPYFSKKLYRGYQRLERGKAGYTSAEALNKILHNVQQRFSINTNKISLFGYSGGAQFAHRYAMLYPERINRLIISSAGWYTFPDKNKNYPYGLKLNQNFSMDLAENLPTFLQLKIRTLVGEFDTNNDPGLNRNKQINRQQGYHRLERAKRWVHALQSVCDDIGVVADLRLMIVKGCGHSFESCERLGNISKYIFTPDN